MSRGNITMVYNAINMPSVMGRPTKYREEFVKFVDDYLQTAVPENMDIPTIEELAVKLDVDDDQINEWTKKYPNFHAAIKKLKMLQKKHLMVVGMFGGKEINPAMAIFLLKNNHGMKDRTDITTNDKDIPAPLLNGQSTETI